MNIPPLLEKLLLSNEATFKNASLGFNALNMLVVPEGKTAVILGYEINAFCNAVVKSDLWDLGISEETIFQSVYSSIAQHMQYQMQIINDKYFTAFTHSPDFDVTPHPKSSGTTDYAEIHLKFNAKNEDLFIYVDRSTYFQFVFADYEFLIPYYDWFSNSFENNAQYIPGQPITFKDSPTNTNFYTYQVTPGSGASSETYNPTRKSQVNQTTYNSYLLPDGEQEYLRFGTNTGSNGSSLFNPFNTMPAPPATPDNVTARFPFVMPTLNVKYVLINKRASDYGITKP